MSQKPTLTFALMDAPFESGRSTTAFRLLGSTTAFRLLDIAAARGYHINVFAYEGAVFIPFAHQKPHANAVHGHDASEENHPLPKDWVAALIESAEQHGGKLDWVNCGLCVDERGAMDTIPSGRRGSPVDFWKMATESDNTLVIGTR